MKLANHKNWANRIFWIYLKRILKSDFHAIKLCDKSVHPQGSVLMLQNHISWWDGFFTYALHNTVLKRKYHVMMLDEKLNEYPFFMKLGAFGIDKTNPRSMVETFNYIHEIMGDPKNLLNFFPQGKIYNSLSPIELETGYRKLIDKYESNTMILYSAIEYQSNRKPTLYLKLDNYNTELSLRDQFENMKAQIDSDIMDGSKEYKELKL